MFRRENKPFEVGKKQRQIFAARAAVKLIEGNNLASHDR